MEIIFIFQGIKKRPLGLLFIFIFKRLILLLLSWCLFP
ncbi:hypothetical protein HMPREF1253_0520 [Peptoniphilus sp. BV3C26]|nr:hypothetical protein HMPREF1253_0520 [Peptoniphilus sp. BV3C26]